MFVAPTSIAFDLTSEHQPSIAWAQRKDQVFLSFDVQDLKDEKIKIESNKLHFEGTSGGTKYVTDLEFWKDLEPAVCNRTFTRLLDEIV